MSQYTLLLSHSYKGKLGHSLSPLAVSANCPLKLCALTFHHVFIYLNLKVKRHGGFPLPHL